MVIECLHKSGCLTYDFLGDGRGVAQLGLARLLWEQEVGGSNPLTPTKYLLINFAKKT